MSLLSALLASAVVLLLCASSAVAQLDVSLTLASDYTSTIRVNGAVWLQSNPVWFTAEGKTYSAADKTLTLGSVETTIGADALGMWNATVISWTAADNPALRWMTLYRSYLHPNNPMAIRAIAFDQVWVSGANNTRASDYNNVLSGFPSFNPKDTKPSLGALQLAGDFDANRQFLWSGSNATLDLIWGAASGPLTLFEEKGRVAVTISPFSSFMAASLANKGGMAVWGVMGSMTSVPAGWSMSTIAVFGQEGITNNVLAWGDVLLTQYGKNRASMYDEFTTQYLGYATDNGAYYYYHTEQGKNYEQTLIDVYTDSVQRSIPYKHMLLDSWWYYKGNLNGAKNWTAMTSIFPDGLQALHANITMPFIGHNRWWAPETDYSTTNGGQYEFVFGTSGSGSNKWEGGLPTEQKFWDDLLRNSSVWGLKVYEQDWLFTVVDSLPIIQQDIMLGRNWLLQMGNGARKAGINIQYCMPYPRHLLQSVEIPNVVQARASPDNVPGSDDNWRVGESDIFTWAVGVAPFKDTFWTTSVQPGNPYRGQEPSPALQAAVATLSTGPVYPSDAIGMTDIALLSKSHRSDGLLLKPDRPAFSLDASMVERVFGSADGPDARQITHTYSEVNGHRWHVLLVAEESHGYQLQLAQVQAMPDTRFVTYYYHNGSSSLPTLTEWTSSSPLVLEPQTRSTATFTVFWAAPVLASGLVVLGDVDKWAPMSRQRVVTMSQWDEGVVLQLSGGPGEMVTISYATMSQQADGKAQRRRKMAGAAPADWMVTQAMCKMSAAGSATLMISTVIPVPICTPV